MWEDKVAWHHNYLTEVAPAHRKEQLYRLPKKMGVSLTGACIYKPRVYVIHLPKITHYICGVEGQVAHQARTVMTSFSKLPESSVSPSNSSTIFRRPRPQNLYSAPFGTNVPGCSPPSFFCR